MSLSRIKIGSWHGRILDIIVVCSLSKDHSTQINTQYSFENFMEAKVSKKAP